MTVIYNIVLRVLETINIRQQRIVQIGHALKFIKIEQLPTYF